MRVFYFSENPYPHLPPEETYESIRVSLPNKHFDPAIGSKLYDRYFDEWQAADELGLNVMVNEHHQTPTCGHPSVSISAGILARITKQARILVLGVPLPNRGDPVRVAEEMAVIDNISHGRLEVGFVRGVPFEVLPANSMSLGQSDRLWEAQDLIVKAWTEHEGPFSWQGGYQYRHVNIWPRPFQQPTPPIWMTTSSLRSVPRIAEHGYTMATFIGGYEFTKELYTAYRENYQRHFGVDSTPTDRLGYMGLLAVGGSTAEGMDRLRRMQWYFDSNKTPRYLSQPPGYVPPQAVLAGARSGPPTSGPAAARGKSAEWLVENGMAFAGSPDDVYAQIQKFYDHVGGFANLLLMGQAGFLEHHEVIDTLTRFSADVKPRIAGFGVEVAAR